MVRKVTLLSLAIPNFLELLFFSLLGICNMFIMSRVSDEAAGAVGACNQIINFTNIVFNVVCVGASVLISQYIGAKDRQSTQKAIIGSFTIVLAIGVTCSAILLFFGKNILSLIGVTPGLMQYAEVYMKIFGGMIFTQALLNISTVVMRTHGYSKESLAITAAMNILNVILVSVLILGFSMGIEGAAVATSLSRGIAMIAAILFVRRHIIEKDSLKYIRSFPRNIMTQLLRIGFPSALENISYNANQLVVTSIILYNLGETAYITRTYTLQIINIFIIMSMAVGQANQILVGRLVGERNYDEAYRTCLKNFKISFLISLGYSSILFLFGGSFIRIFTADPEIIRWSAAVFMVGAFLEPGRTFNLVIINGLKGAGDVVFPVIMAVIFMWGVAASGAYIFGVALSLGLPGIWIAMSLDEWARGFIMLFRWRGRKWTTKSLIKEQPVEDL